VHFSGAAFDNAVALEHADERSEEALAIEQETLAFYVFAVEGRLHGDFEFVATVNLSPAGEANGNVIRAVLVTFSNQIVLVPQGRTRTDDTHGAAKDVEHLREFIEAGLAEEPAHAGNPFLGVAEFMRRGILGGVGAHGAELVDEKVSLVDADAFLPKEHRPLAVKLDGDRDNEHREC